MQLCLSKFIFLSLLMLYLLLYNRLNCLPFFFRYQSYAFSFEAKLGLIVKGTLWSRGQSYGSLGNKKILFFVLVDFNASVISLVVYTKQTPCFLLDHYRNCLAKTFPETTPGTNLHLPLPPKVLPHRYPQPFIYASNLEHSTIYNS